MEIGELIHILLGMIAPDRCPFCKDPEETDTFTTYKGNTNNSTTLRTIMNDPTCLTTEQSNARPKNGDRGHQAPDPVMPSPNPIFTDNTTMYPGLSAVVGSYGDEAHHSISGNECMKGESIEDVIKDSGRSNFEKDTGYSINNAANGVYLPSWHRSRWGDTRPDGKWGDLPDTTKYAIMRTAMRGSAGQAHIGAHEGKTTVKHPRSYPAFVKGRLNQIQQRVFLRMADCPYCKENGQPKRPAPAPYGVNQWLDALSTEIRLHVTGHPRSWKYFVSQYAATYHDELCRHGTIAEVLPNNWPPV
jgi:hypothetical protein